LGLAGHAWAQTPRAQGLGQLVVSGPGQTPARLEIRRCWIHVDLRPPRALVQVDQSFYNPYHSQVEGTYVFNLPPGASVCRLAMFIERDRLVEGELIDRQRASHVFESIVRSMRDPAILEQIGDNLFKIRVFPIFARDEKRILMDFTVPLVGEAGKYRFTLPLACDLGPIDDLQLTGTIHGQQESLRPRSVSHPELKFTPDDAGVQFAWRKSHIQPTGEFSVEFAIPGHDRPSLRTYQAEPLATEKAPKAAPDTYFLATLPPHGTAPAQATPADVLILVDTSAAVRGQKALRQAVHTVVDALRPADRLRIACLDSACRHLATDWQPAGSAERRALLERLDNELDLGRADLSGSLAEAFKVLGPPTAGRRRVVVWLGMPRRHAMAGFEETIAGRLEEMLCRSDATFFAVPLQRASDQELLAYLARVSGGLVFEPLGSPQGGRALTRWTQARLTPAEAVAVEAEGVHASDLFYRPARFAWEPLEIYGHGPRTDHVRLRLSTTVGGRSKSERWELRATDESDYFVGRLWGEHKFRQVDQQRTEGEPADSAIRQAALALAREWSLLTPLTAFLVLENEADYKRWNIDRQSRRRYWGPPAALPDRTEKRPRRVTRESVAAGRLKLENMVRRAAGESLRNALAAELGGRLALLDPSARRDSFDLRPTRLRLGAPAPTAEFIRRHPHAAGLMRQEVIPNAPIALKDLTHMMSDLTGSSVILDQRAFDDLGLKPDSQLTPWIVGRMSLGAYLRHALRDADLTFLEEPRRLLITTPEQAEKRLNVELYPLADLLDPRRVAETSLLVDPCGDRQRTAHERIRARLARPISVDCRQEPLCGLVEKLARQLDIPVVLERPSLKHQGVDCDAPITIQCKNVPAGEALKWVVESLNLCYVLDDEALVITTPEQAESRLEVRLYSGRGLVCRVPSRPDEDGIRGMGGMGFFGGGGMGGMGGMGGGIGGMAGGGGASVAGPPSGSASAGGEGLSSGGDATAPSPAVHATAEDDAKPTRLALAAAPPVEPTPAPDAEADFESMIELITATVQPTVWDTVGGPSSIHLYEPTLDFVVSASADQHDEVRRLLDKLRVLPIRRPDLGYEPVRSAPPPDLETTRRWLESTLGTIIGDVKPSYWDTMGGPCSISYDEPRQVFVINATAEMHDAVAGLLTKLRRSRYEALRGERPWERWTGQLGKMWVAGSGAGDSEPVAERCPPRADELAALASRRLPESGRWQWRRFGPDGRPRETIELRRNGERSEIDLPQATIRIEGERAAVAYRDYRMVELGNRAEMLRQRLDVLLPWMPHRTNAELAGLFEVARLAASPDGPAGRTRVRLGLMPEPEKNGLEMTLAHDSGQAMLFEARIDGRLTQRLRLEIAGQTVRSARLEDAGGRLVGRWELVAADDRAPAIGALGEWPGYAVIDDCEPRPAFDVPLHDAFQAIEQLNWPKAAERLDVAIERHGRHPLVVLLRAWCMERMEGRGRHAEILQSLREVASTGVRGLVEFIAEGDFANLTPAEKYDVLGRQPAATRTADDAERLALAARAADRPLEALTLVRAAASAPGADVGFLVRERLEIDLLLRLGRTAEAIARIEPLAVEPPTNLDRLTDLFDLLVRHRQNATADRLYSRLLDAKSLSTETRWSLLVRQAETRQELSRWRALLMAAQQAPQAVARRQLVEQVIEEIREAGRGEAAHTLATEIGDRQTQERLLRCQLQLAASQRVRADIYWRLFTTGRLRSSDVDRACAALEWASRPEQVAAVCENVLRSGESLTGRQCDWLAQAYRDLRRPADAARVESEQPWRSRAQ
jgi:hypothetical protein